MLSEGPALVTTRSGRPSPSRSPTATVCEGEEVPAGELSGGRKLPSPLPNRIVTLPGPLKGALLTTARSANPSPLKSPTATDLASAGARKTISGGPNVPSPRPSIIATPLEATGGAVEIT